MDSELHKLRRALRVSNDVKEELKFMIPANDMYSEEEDNSNYDEKTNQSFYDRLTNLLDGNQEAIRYFISFFKLNAPELLLEAITSMKNFQAFLKFALLSDNDTTQFNALLVILIITYDDNDDNSFFTDPQILAFLSLKIQDRLFDWRITALKVIINLIDQYSPVYEFFSQTNFVGQLISIADFRDEENDSTYKQAFYREERILNEISNASLVITKKNLFKPEESSIIWNTSIFLLSKDTETEARCNSIDVMSLLLKSGYIGPIPECIMNYFSSIVYEAYDIFIRFALFVSCLPNVNDFFADLFNHDFIYQMMDVIDQDIDKNPKEIYKMLGDLKLNIENEDFIALTLSKLRGPSKFYTRVMIVYYLTRIIYTTSTSLIQLLMNHDVFIDIDEILSSQESNVVHICLDFIENLINCYSIGFQKKVSTFPNVNIMENDLEELLCMIDNDADEQISRILEKIRQ